MAYFFWRGRICRVTKMARDGDFIQIPRKYLLVVISKKRFFFTFLSVEISKKSPAESSVVLRPQILGFFGFTPRFA